MSFQIAAQVRQQIFTLSQFH